MKKRLLQIIMAISVSAMVLSGCEGISFGKDNNTVESTKDKKDKKDKDKKNKKDKNLLTEKDIDIDALKENDGVMLSIKHSDWGEVSSEEDYWSHTVYDVYYDGTIIITEEYNLSGSNIAGGQLSDEDYITMYLFGVNAANNDSLSDVNIEASDGDAWSFTFYDEDENAISLYSGYTYGEKQLEDIQDILIDYENDFDFTPMTDGASGGYEYEFIPERGSWEEAYYDKLKETIAMQEEDYPDGPYAANDGTGYPYAYSLCDITGDDIPELIIKKGTCEADYNDDVYSYDGREVKYIGNIWSGHSAFYSNPDGGMFQYMGHMGYGALDLITVDDDELVFEELLEESGYDDNGEWIEDFEYTDVTTAYPGSKYIGYEDINNFLYLDAYDGVLPEYSYSKDVADKDSAMDFYTGLYDTDEIVYAVGDGYMNNVGAINFQSLFDKGVIYEYMNEDVTVEEFIIADVDGNGSYECVLYFAEGDSDYISYEGILSLEDGTVYCYLIFSQLSTYMTDDGYFLEYDEYPVKPIFYKDKILWEKNY